MKKENSFKRIIVVGNTSPTGYNARFVSSGGVFGNIMRKRLQNPIIGD